MRTVKVAVLCSIILLLFLLLTNPEGLPSVALIVPFVLLFIVFLAAILILLGIYAMPRQKKLKVGLIGAAVPVLLLVLQSLGQLTVRDVLAVLVLFCATYFYISRLGMQGAS